VERITRALELARAQREGTLDAAIAIAKPESSDAGATEFSGMPPFKMPVIELNPAVQERERILPPGAAGEHGASYKMLRTQVVKRLDQLNANTLAILSPEAASGKTLTAINLAIAIAAERGRTVLLVDFDFRNPSIHRRFGFEPQVGIEDCLQSRRPIHEAMVKVAGYDRLTLLPARNKVEHSSELLAEKLTAEVMAEMRGRYVNRIVIFDLPPVLQADDALMLSRHVQAGLMVVSEGRTRRDGVTRSIGLLNQLPIVGTVLNGSRTSSGTAY